MVPTWADFGSQKSPKTRQNIQRKSRKAAPEPIWASTWHQLSPGAALGSPNLTPEPIWDRFWVDLGPILFDFATIFDWILTELKKLLHRLLSYPQPRACWIMQPPQINQNHAKISKKLTPEPQKSCPGPPKSSPEPSKTTFLKDI